MNLLKQQQVPRAPEALEAGLGRVFPIPRPPPRALQAPPHLAPTQGLEGLLADQLDRQHGLEGHLDQAPLWGDGPPLVPRPPQHPLSAPAPGAWVPLHLLGIPAQHAPSRKASLTTAPGPWKLESAAVHGGSGFGALPGPGPGPLPTRHE